MSAYNVAMFLGTYVLSTLDRLSGQMGMFTRSASTIIATITTVTTTTVVTNVSVVTF